MNKINDVAVVVPVYKETLTVYEYQSYVRCLNVLRNHEIILIAPEGISLNSYLEQGLNIKVKYLPKLCFQSHAAYDRMMLTRDFYDLFLNYRYILIHQLDAFVFQDELLEWCRQSYDYVGAPWIDNPVIDSIASNSTRMRRLFYGKIDRLHRQVGNGGFSLRKVKSFHRNLTLFKNKAAKWPYYEDTFFSFFLTSYNPFFNVPDVKQALKFAFEANPAKCFDINSRQLPFGCHAWEKYDKEFWRPIFGEYGYVI